MSGVPARGGPETRTSRLLQRHGLGRERLHVGCGGREMVPRIVSCGCTLGEHGPR